MEKVIKVEDVLIIESKILLVFKVLKIVNKILLK